MELLYYSHKLPQDFLFCQCFTLIIYRRIVSVGPKQNLLNYQNHLQLKIQGIYRIYLFTEMQIFLERWFY